jgi:6-phosphogluconolactonase (cycloisomerase 2 family)
VDPTGRYLYVANSGGNTVSGFAMQNGIATPVSGSPFAVGNQPVALQTDPSGKFLYVTDFADGTVTVLAINRTTGALTAVSGSPFGGGSGAGAVSIAVDPVGSFAYVANQTAATITAYSIDLTTGALSASGSPLSTASAPQSIAVGPAAGNFVYAANVTSSNYVASYAIAQSLPHAVAVDPSGQFVYAANQNSGNVSVFTVDAATGALTEVTGSPFLAGSGARSIAID